MSESTYTIRRIIGRRFGIRPHMVRRADIKRLMGYFDMADLSSLNDEDREVFIAEGKKRGLFSPSRHQ
jgi:hypothetical protein